MKSKNELQKNLLELTQEKQELIKEREHIKQKYPSPKIIILHIAGIAMVYTLEAVFGTLPLITLLFTISIPTIYTLKENKKIKNLTKEINVLNSKITSVVSKLDIVHEQERQEWERKQQEAEQNKPNRWIEALNKPMPEKITQILEQRPDHIPGTDKVRTFVTNVPGLYSEESDMKNIIANRDRAFKDRDEEPKLKRSYK